VIASAIELKGRSFAMNEEHVDEIVELSAPLGKLRERLAQLDAERAAVQADIDRRVAALATLTNKHFLPIGPDATIREKLHALFKSDPQRRLRATDIAEIFGYRYENDIENVRRALARMVKAGILNRVQHGQYALRR
jgi:response regulator of citrate/malate metabolism